jgi:hypothetical protein
MSKQHRRRRVRRGFHPLAALPPVQDSYVRWCDDCGHVSESDDPRHLLGWVECPACTIAAELRPTRPPTSTGSTR